MNIDTVRARKMASDKGRMRDVWGNGTTHFYGCEYSHYVCAINALCDEVDNLRKRLSLYEESVIEDGWIGVDLDGTLAETIDWTKGCGIGDPIPTMVERVKWWLAEGEEVRILTARVAVTNEFSPISNRFADEEFRDEQIELIEAWCEKHIGQRLPITSQKDFKMSCLYDDRCVQVERNTGRLIDAKF